MSGHHLLAVIGLILAVLGLGVAIIPPICPRSGSGEASAKRWGILGLQCLHAVE